MRSFFILFIAIFTIFTCFGQDNKATDYSKVDKFALSVPDSVTTNIAQLAEYLTSSTFTPSTEKKIRAIFVWVSQNISYDKSFDLETPFTTAETVAKQDADRVLAARTGVCMGYAQLFVALVQSAGLKAEMIEGVIRQSDGKIPRMGHAWVAVRLRKKAEKGEKTEPTWFLCDPTWATPQSKAEYGKINESYFLAEPEEFIKDHLPLDPMWQLVEHPATIEVFSTQTEAQIAKYVSKASKNPFMFQDTINQFLKMDSLKRLEKATWRMLHYNPINEYIWFQVGKIYSNRFSAYENKIAQLLLHSIDESTVLADDEKFEKMLGILRLYCGTFKDCFDKIDDKMVTDYYKQYNENYLKALTSAYRSAYKIACFNKIIEANDKNTPRLLETVNAISTKIDSTMASSRKAIKPLDTITQRSMELKIQYFEKLYHLKRSVFLFQYLETWRMSPIDINLKAEVNTMLAQGRYHTRRYQNCIDSTDMILYRKRGMSIPDGIFEQYSFLFDIEECAINSNFLFQIIEKKVETAQSKNMMPYIQSLRDAQNCAELAKERWRNSSKVVEESITTNTDYFKLIFAVNEAQLGGLCHSIAISLWNENLTNKAAIKEELLQHVTLANNSYNNAADAYRALLKNKKNDSGKGYQSVIDDLLARQKKVLELRKDVE